ncbi:unnamed protein product [Amoebophrya sp. A25]|nr:unnamed protein product [Amoebophrya sp. A25]|eukprot:GSA25T00025963001.1
MMTPSKGLASAVSECAVVDDMQQHENSERADEDQHLVSSDEEGRVVDEEADEEENPNALTPADKHADGKEDNESVFEQESSEHSSAGEGMAKDYLQAGGDNDSDSDGEFRQAGQDGEEAAAGASQAEEDAYAMDHAESSPMNNKIYDSNHDEDEVESASPGDSPSPTDSLSPVDEEQEIYEAWAPHLFEMDEGSSSTTTGEVNALPSCRASKDGSKSTCETTAAASSPCPTTDDEEPQSLVPPYPADGVLPVGSFLPFQQDAPLATATGGGAEADGRAQEVAAQVVHSMFFKKARQGSSSSSVLTKPILDAPPALRTGTLAVPFSLVSPAQLEDLLNAVGRIFLAEGIVVKPVHSLPTKVFGSLHGQLVDLLTFFQSFGFPHLSLELGDLSYTHYVFLGDYVDRGAQSLELLTLLFALKLQAPERVTLLRGHHENRHVNAHLGFRQECEARLPPGDGARLYDMINRTFELMPLACQLRSGFLCLPNGLPRLLDHELREHRTSAAGLRSLTHLESLMGTKPVIVPRPQALHSGDDLSESELFLVRYFYPHLSEVSGSSEKSGSTEEFLRESGGLCAVITSRRIPEGGAALAPLSIAEAEDGRGTQRDQSSSEGDRQEEKADPSRLNEISLVSCADVGGLTRNRAAMLQIVCDSKMNTHRVVIRRVASGPSSVAWELFVELFCGGSVALGLGVSENPEGEEENGVSRTAESHKEMRHLVCAVPETCAQFSRWPAQPMALTPRRVVHSAHSSSEDTLCVELLYPIDGSAPFTRTDRLKPAAVMALDTADRVDIASLNPLLLRTHSTGMPRGAEDAGTGPLQPRVWGKALSVFDSLVSYNGESLLSVSEHAVVDWLTERTQGDTSLGATAAVRSGTLARWVRSFLVFHRSSTEATNSQITAADFLWGIVASSGSVSLSEESLATRFSNYAVFARAAVVLQLRADEGVSDWDDGGALLEHSATRYGSADALDFFRDIFSHFL